MHWSLLEINLVEIRLVVDCMETDELSHELVLFQVSVVCPSSVRLL